MRVLIGWFGHETNTFSRVKSDFDLLTSQGCWEGDEILEVFRGTPSYLGGMIRCADEKGIELIPTFGVENAGPTLTDECVDIVLGKILSYIRENMGRFDGICLGLHGAGCSETRDDLESYVLKAVREIVGYEIPITITLDLHGNVTEEMCREADGIFGIKENPHIDYDTTGYEAMDALLKAIKKEVRLQTNVVPLPMLVPITVTSDYKEVKEYLEEYRRKHNLLELAFFPGFPYSDTPVTNASVFVTTDGDPGDHAERMAEYIWENRGKIVNIESFSAEEAVAIAGEYISGNAGETCVINEESDNPGAGTPGDGTGLLKPMIEANIKDSAFGYIYDPEVVEKAFEAGVGARIDIHLGGKIEEEEMHGEPLYLKDVEVCTLSDGNFISTTPLMLGIPGSFGRTVGLKHRNVHMVVASVQNQTYDDRSFFVGGVDISQMRLLGVKSSQHFKAFFRDYADKIIPANPIGLSTRNLKLFKYKRTITPIYPLCEDVEFKI